MKYKTVVLFRAYLCFVFFYEINVIMAGFLFSGQRIPMKDAGSSYSPTARYRGNGPVMPLARAFRV